MNLDVSWTRRSAEFKDNLAKPINQRMDPVTRTPTSYVRYRLETPSRNVSEAEKAHHTECLIYDLKPNRKPKTNLNTKPSINLINNLQTQVVNCGTEIGSCKGIGSLSVSLFIRVENVMLITLF